MTRSIRRGDLCYLCGEALGLTKDHVPPKLLFPSKAPQPGVPQSPIGFTLWACAPCNRRLSSDEEYLGSYLSLVADTPDAEAVAGCRWRLRRSTPATRTSSNAYSRDVHP